MSQYTAGAGQYHDEPGPFFRPPKGAARIAGGLMEMEVEVDL